MHKLFVLIIMAWFFVCGCATNDGADDNKDEISVSYKKRKKILDKWIGSMDTENAVIANIAEIMRNSLYVAEPAPSPKGYDYDLGIRVLEEASANDIPVVVALPGDENIGADWKLKIESFWGALFIPDYPMMIIRDDEVSDFWRGIIMVYEGVPVAAHIMGSFDSIGDPLGRIVTGEFHAYNLIFDVLNRKGGEKYQEILNEKTFFVEAQFKKKGIYPPPDFLGEDRLNDVFSEAPLSPEEIHVRWKIFWIHSVFGAIEKANNEKDVQDKEKVKYLLMLL